jgi:hypothetical protein
LASENKQIKCRRTRGQVIFSHRALPPQIPPKTPSISGFVNDGPTQHVVTLSTGGDGPPSQGLAVAEISELELDFKHPSGDLARDIGHVARACTRPRACRFPPKGVWVFLGWFAPVLCRAEFTRQPGSLWCKRCAQVSLYTPPLCSRLVRIQRLYTGRAQTFGCFSLAAVAGAVTPV